MKLLLGYGSSCPIRPMNTLNGEFEFNCYDILGFMIYQVWAFLSNSKNFPLPTVATNFQMRKSPHSTLEWKKQKQLGKKKV